MTYKNEFSKSAADISRMWLLRNGRRIRVELYTDPSWNREERWSFSIAYAKFLSEGFGVERAEALAAASIWKTKWKGIVYDPGVEQALRGTHQSV